MRFQHTLFPPPPATLAWGNEGKMEMLARDGRNPSRELEVGRYSRLRPRGIDTLISTYHLKRERPFTPGMEKSLIKKRFSAAEEGKVLGEGSRSGAGLVQPRGRLSQRSVVASCAGLAQSPAESCPLPGPLSPLSFTECPLGRLWGEGCGVLSLFWCSIHGLR